MTLTVRMMVVVCAFRVVFYHKGFRNPTGFFGSKRAKNYQVPSMGIYTNSCLYYGRLLRNNTLDELRKKKPVPDSFLMTIIEDEYTVLHAPGKYLNIGGIDPIIEVHEREQGYISLDEVMGQLENHKEWYDAWTSTTPEDLQLLEEYVRLAADDESAKPGTYIAEIEWCTLEGPGDPGTLKANLPCMKVN